MYQRPAKLLAILIFVFMLLFPRQVLEGAKGGLLLWFNSVLPTLLPFIILSNLLIRTHAIDWIVRVTGPLLRRIFHVSDYGSFAVVCGFLCGYPMGSKVIADLLRAGRIHFFEAQYLLSFCNNASPAFIVSYLALQNLGREELALPLLSILLLAPVLTSLAARRVFLANSHTNHRARRVFLANSHTNRHENRARQSAAQNRTASRQSANRQTVSREIKGGDGSLIDSCIMDGFEVITKVGGYIMLFSIFLSLAEMLPFSGVLYRCLLLPSLEITSGVSLLCQSPLTEAQKLFLCTSCASFGGWCAAAQTQCMISDTGLSIRVYIIQKLATALAASFLCYIYLRFLH